ncbi:DUF7510 family protein [Halorarius litoreus]|uniref:DUF7510 family protein n=1 Tax=Halorarius litoreus TaxID=2962676 RepID=UPI0020CC3B2F|nr:hypothetical protein [Halorarius litoreus]
MAAEADTPEKPVSIDIDVENGKTTITVSGDREVAVVVRSASGERVYLPPERTASPGGTTPYDPAEDGSSPYEGYTQTSPYDGRGDASPYSPGRQSPPEEGMMQTAKGFKIFHPEPATDVRILR